MDVAVNARLLLGGRRLEGIGRYSLAVVRALAAARPDDTFHLLFDRPHDPRFLVAPNVVPHVLQPPARHPLLFLAWFEVSVAAWLRRRRPAVFVSPDGFTTLATSVPRLTVVHDLAFAYFPQDVSRAEAAYYRTMTPRFVDASRRLICVSEATKQDVVSRYGVAPARIDVVHPQVEPAFTPAADERVRDVAQRHAGGHPYFVFVGAIQPRKNLPRLLQAFDRFVAHSSADVRLLIVGRQAWKTGPTAQALQAMSRADAVVLTGPLSDEDLAALYTGALATVFVPYFEGFGIPPVEAMACGCPAIVSDRSAMPEAAGDAALLVNPYDVAAIADALERVATEPGLREDLRARGLVNVRRFSPEVFATSVVRSFVATLDAAGG